MKRGIWVGGFKMTNIELEIYITSYRLEDYYEDTQNSM